HTSHHFSFSSSYSRRHNHSYPTRRSSDLIPATSVAETNRVFQISWNIFVIANALPAYVQARTAESKYRNKWRLRSNRTPTTDKRSEEHTSELQSRFDLVCSLLLEKKKQIL